MHPEAARALAGRVKDAVRTRIGARLTCSIGLAPNKFLAKSASDMEKPDGLVTILPEDLPQILHGLALRDLCGIGPRMEARLRAHSIETVEHLCAASRTLLHKVWGGVGGKLFHDALHGAPTVANTTERRSLGHSHVLPPELRTVDGERPSFLMAAAHGVMLYLSWLFLPVFLVSLVAPDKRCLHDMLAGLIAVRRPD